MPFVEDAQRVTSRVHAGNVPVPARLGIAALSLVVLVLVAGNVFTALTQPPLSITKGNASSEAAYDSSEQVQAPSSMRDAAPAAPATVFVYVSGAVASPGVYELAQGSRVVDAVGAAGGFAADASQDAVNLARIVQDGEQVAIPVVGQEPAAPVEGQVGSTEPSGGSSLVNINTATEAELESLPGIGPATAAKIVQSREAEGPFASPEDLMRVSGIGQKKYASLAELVCV